MKSNYHTHTSRCGHAVGSDEQYILAAIEAGLTHLGMSDHIPFKHFSNKSDRMDYSELNDYLLSMRFLKEKYRNQIKLSIGFEVEYYPEFQAYYDELKKEVDYFICGQHYKVINEYGYDYYCSDEDLKVYADQVCAAMRSKQFLFLAHPDYFMLGRRNWNQASINAAHQIASCAQETGVPLEINLRGMKYGIKRYGNLESYAYPFMPFWEIVSQYKVKTVLSMDAHSPMNLFEFYKFEAFYEDFKKLNLLPVEPYTL